MVAEKSLKEKLIAHNIKPSYQRTQILKYLMENATHPTVEEIYRALVEQMPTLSKTTVYNTLKIFIERDLAQALTIEDTEARYDGNPAPHGHFKCRKCEKIFDFAVDTDKILTEELEGYTIEEQSIYLKGICKECNNKHQER